MNSLTDMTVDTRPLRMFKKGNQVYFFDAPKQLDIDSTEITDYNAVVDQIKNAGSETNKLKLLRNYSQLYGWTREQALSIAEEAGITVIKADKLQSVSYEICNVLFDKYMKKYGNDIEEFTSSENWKMFKEEEFTKILKNGTADIAPVKIDNLRQFLKFKKGKTDKDFKFDENEYAKHVNTIYSISTGASWSWMDLWNYVNSLGVLPLQTSSTTPADPNKIQIHYLTKMGLVLKYYDRELNKCLNKELKNRRESGMDQYVQLDGRRRRRRSRLHSDGRKTKSKTGRTLKIKKSSRKLKKSKKSDGRKKKSKKRSKKRLSKRN